MPRDRRSSKRDLHLAERVKGSAMFNMGHQSQISASRTQLHAQLLHSCQRVLSLLAVSDWEREAAFSIL